MEVKYGGFNYEILSNGKVVAIKKSEIRFPLDQNIEHIYVKNGDFVRKGQVLAQLDDRDLKNKLAKSVEAVEKATVDLEDRLIDYGYRLRDSVNIPRDIMRMAKIKSAYNSMRFNYDDAVSDFSKARIVAPFSGKVADVEARALNSTDSFKKLCFLIDDRIMHVEFNVLETEYYLIRKGSNLEVSPFGKGTSLIGFVTQINPIVDDDGMIKVFGKIDNSKGYLLNGMNVKITIKVPIGDVLYVPREAVVKRGGRDVVFTYEKDKAKWNYVEVGPQNSKFISIKSGLRQGQIVIINNNINLVHDSLVSLSKDNSSS